MGEQNVNVVNATQENVVDSQTSNIENTSTASVNGDVATSTVETKHVQSPEENARFAEIRRRAEQEARDKVIAELYGQSHGIYTWADYQKAVKAQEEAQERERLSQALPEDVASELLEIKRFKQEYEKEKKARAEQEARTQMFNEFISAYPNVKPEEIPAEVWEEVNKGKHIIDAYAKYENKLLRQQLEEFKKGTTTQQTNIKNAQTTTGSVTGQGTIQSDFISRDVFEANRNDRDWLYRNYEKLKESMKKWK